MAEKNNKEGKLSETKSSDTQMSENALDSSVPQNDTNNVSTSDGIGESTKKSLDEISNQEITHSENYGWVYDSPSPSTREVDGNVESKDTVDYLPSYHSAVSQPTAPPLSHESDEEHEAVSSEGLSTKNVDANELPSNPDADSHVQKILNSEVKKISVKINLIRAAKRLIQFLKFVDNQGDLYSGEKVKAAIYRYEHMWLPLVAKNSDVYLSPPLDVHWVWIVHMLSPQHYEHDCISIAGKVIPHRLMTTKALIRSREFGRAAWEKHYPDESWDLHSEDVSSSGKYCLENSTITYQLENAIHRQSAFFYQVSMEHYNSKAFLCKAVHRYRQFLALKKTHPEKFLVPCYDMDVIWHSHQVHPVIYKDDTTKILGQIFPHDDSVNNRAEGSKLVVSDSITRDIWLSSFGTTFRREGAMFRGDPPSSYLNTVSDDALKSSHISLFHVEITKVKIQGNLPNGPLKLKLKQENRKLAECTVFHTGSGTTEHNVVEMDLKFSITERGLRDWIVLKISSDKKIGKLLKFLGKGTFWCMTNLTEFFTIDEQGIITKSFSDEESPSVVELEFNVVRELTSSWVPIGIMTGDFMPTILDPQTLVSFFGMVTKTKSDNQDIYLAEMATHRLLNESNPAKPQIMEIEVYHSKHFLFSAIHLYIDNPSGGRSLVGLAHTIDLNTIPSPMALKYNIGSQLEAAIATLNVNAGERAMLIKTKGKDWALLVGRWEGLRRGVKGSFSARGIPGSPGNLVVKLYCPIGESPVTVTLPYQKQVYAFQLPDLYIDMERGRLQISHQSDDFVEQICLGLTITVLHVLCQPRPAIPDTVDGEADSPQPQGPDAPKRIPTERLKFLAALGFFCASAPTNTVLTKEIVEEKKKRQWGGGYEGMYLPMYLHANTDSAGACGSCGGCGGCGGGVFETINPPSSVLWGSSQNNGSGNNDGGAWGDGEGGNDWGGWTGDSGGGGGETSGNLFTTMFEGGDGGGDGGGCGGCGGCGG